MQFSRRTAWAEGENAWAQACREAREAGAVLVDLTMSNPTACGLGLRGEEVLRPLGDAGALRYQPDPLGMRMAREAVATYYSEHGAIVQPERLCLTTSTSEAYSFLFRLLCDPGDEVLIARPSYPLFDLLAQVEDVVLREYPLFYDPGTGHGGENGWSIDLHSLRQAITSRTRAVIVVHPNNPTGNYVTLEDAEALRQVCAERGLALLVDEVFLDYSTGTAGGAPSFAGTGSECLCFVLSGLSKICALPQMKLSWIAASGPEPVLRVAMERLEIVADTFLSVNAPTQWALPHWLGARSAVQQQIGERLRANLSALDQVLVGTSASRYAVEAGWTAVLRVPGHVDGEEFALAAVRSGVIVQPGSFYGLPPGRCVVSLLTPPGTWAEGLARLPIW